MAKKQEVQVFCGLELGTSSIKAVIANIDEKGAIEVIGFGTAKSLGICKGEIINVDLATEQLKAAMGAAADSAGIDVQVFAAQPFFLAISGIGVEVHRASKSIEVDRQNAIISQQMAEDLSQQIIIEKNSGATASGEFFQAVLNCYRLSNDRRTFSPVGQVSSSLESEIQYFTMDEEHYETLINMVSTFIKPSNIHCCLYAPLAIGAAIMPPVVGEDNFPFIIDIGGGVTSLIMHSPIGSLVCEQIPIGCEHIINDLQIGLDVSINQARRLLTQMSQLSCTAIAVKDGRSRKINISGDNSGESRFVPASSVEIIVEARLRELFLLIKQRLVDLKVDNLLGNDIYLSGGGALIPRVTELASSIFHRKVKVGIMSQVSCSSELKDPRYNTVIGLIRGGYRDLQVQFSQNEKNIGHGIWKWLCEFWRRFNA